MIRQFRTDPGDRCLSDIGTGIRYPLEVRKHAGIGSIRQNIALSAAHTFQMIFLHQAEHILHNVDHRIDPVCRRQISPPECQIRLIEHIMKQFLCNMDGIQCLSGESGSGCVHINCCIRYIIRQIAQMLQLGNDFIVLIQDPDMIRLLQIGKKVDHIPACPVGKLLP